MALGQTVLGVLLGQDGGRHGEQGGSDDGEETHID
jgi:hypothetical protein